VIVFDRWSVAPLELEQRGLAELWLKLQSYPTLFSDSTRGDLRAWIDLLRAPDTIWFDVSEGEESVGLIYFRLQDDDAEIHPIFFDRKPAEKCGLLKFVCKFVFDSLPVIERISASVPEIYHGTSRLAIKTGFKWEGKKRQAVKLNGKRFDVNLYGLLRAEAYGLPEESGESLGSSRGVRSGWDTRREDRVGSSGGRVGT
jgi:RimJ/RimL family protein N-acetyltransferase